MGTHSFKFTVRHTHNLDTEKVLHALELCCNGGLHLMASATWIEDAGSPPDFNISPRLLGPSSLNVVMTADLFGL